MKKILAALVLPAVGFAAVSTPATAARPAKSDATITATARDSLTASTGLKVGDSLVFSGCGYAPGAGVTVAVEGPVATSFFGGPADAAGCYSSANLVAYWAQDAGTYTVNAWQSSKRRPDATSSFTVTN